MPVLSNNWRSEFECYLEDLATTKDVLVRPLFDAIKYSLCSGGKRIRPMLLLSFYSLYDEDYRKAFPFAAALEMIHASSLIHDDMPCMDDDALRRGRPTLHCTKGESMAMIAGDALLNLAYETMMNAAKDLKMLTAMRTIARSAGALGVQGGQYLDTEVSEKTIEVVVATYELKTACLIEGACLAGVQLAGASNAEEKAASEYGKKLGVAFQIQDDILDVVGQVELTGKMTGNDEKCQKTTYLSLYGMEKAEADVAQLLADANDALRIFGKDAEPLIHFTEALVGRKM